jgi:hypothetical protein
VCHRDGTADQGKEQLFSRNTHDVVNNPFEGYFFMHNFKRFLRLTESQKLIKSADFQQACSGGGNVRALPPPFLFIIKFTSI